MKILDFIKSMTPSLGTKAVSVTKKTKTQWINVLVKLGSDMKAKGTKYRWKTPVNESVSMKNSTCVSYVSLALQRLGYLPKGQYIHFTDTGKLHGTGASYVRQHTELFQVIYSGKSPQKAGLQVGDIVGYKTHIMVFAGWASDKKTPLWYSLERSSKGIGNPVKITNKGVFKYYNTRAISYIIRLKFASQSGSSGTSQSVQNTSASASTKKIQYKLKMQMNFRKAASAKASKICTIPKGTVLTQISKSGTWIKTTYKGKTGWVNVASKYATKV